MARGEASRDAPVPVPGESVCDDSQVPSNGPLVCMMEAAPFVWHHCCHIIFPLVLVKFCQLLWYRFYFSIPMLLATLLYMSPAKRICVFEHSVMTNFNCACPAIQTGQGFGFLSEGSSWLIACMSEQRRFWRDCADAQARLNIRCSHRR